MFVWCLGSTVFGSRSHWLLALLEGAGVHQEQERDCRCAISTLAGLAYFCSKLYSLKDIVNEHGYAHTNTSFAKKGIF